MKETCKLDVFAGGGEYMGSIVFKVAISPFDHSAYTYLIFLVSRHVVPIPRSGGVGSWLAFLGWGRGEAGVWELDHF